MTIEVSAVGGSGERDFFEAGNSNAPSQDSQKETDHRQLRQYQVPQVHLESRRLILCHLVTRRYLSYAYLSRLLLRITSFSGAKIYYVVNKSQNQN